MRTIIGKVDFGLVETEELEIWKSHEIVDCVGFIISCNIYPCETFSNHGA